MFNGSLNNPEPDDQMAKEGMLSDGEKTADTKAEAPDSAQPDKTTDAVPIPTDEIKDKLHNLSKYLPSEDELVYQYGIFLADRLRSQITPRNFVMLAQTSLVDLQKGIDGFGNQITNKLAGKSPMVYSMLEKSISEIARAVFPEEFADSVETIQKKF
jgi:hypothetical protein